MIPAYAKTSVDIFPEEPFCSHSPEKGVWWFDFGRVAFGNLEILAACDVAGVEVHFGEALSEGRIDRQPPGSVRYASTRVSLRPGIPLRVAPPADERNTGPSAVPLPEEWGVILPFRWVEIEGWPAGAEKPQIRRRAAYARGWDDAAASFASSDALLNQIWELCRYSIKATTFAGVYVDGDRERIPYEADAYLNQLSHYAVEGGLSMARDTFDHLMRYPTWPTEWAHHLIFMVHADWMHSGETAWMAERYESLKTKLLQDRVGAAGLIEGTPEQVKKDIVDWPPGERDDFVFMPLNTVVNAFYLRSLVCLSEMARALGREEEASDYEEQFNRAAVQFHQRCFDPACGLYRDGEGTEHHAFHANLFPMAFELVPQGHRRGILDFLVGKGMACSVYPAQYLFEALFAQGRSTEALALMMAPGDRSWRHMVESGTTITWEAWDQRYKPNQDWNHAWGAAPANLLPRYVLGVQAKTPGWNLIRICPCPGSLQFCRGKVPTPRGPVEVEWRQDQNFSLTFEVPPGSEAMLVLPSMGGGRVRVDGRPAAAVRSGNYLQVTGEWTGRHSVEVY